jgi:hypothetical protein
MRRYIIYFIYSLYLSTFFSCTSNEIGNSKDVNPDAVYFDYRIYGDEKDENMTVYLQYRMGGKNGTTLVLNEPAKVKLDGEEIKADSAKLSGAFYEVEKSRKSFEGKHEIIFTDLNNKEHKEEFSFTPLKLRTNIPAVINRGDLAFDFDGVEQNEYIRVVAIDTSFHSRDINEIDTVSNGRIVIKADHLKNIVNGHITLQFSKELEKALKNGMREGGRISVSYTIQREFQLKD